MGDVGFTFKNKANGFALDSNANGDVYGHVVNGGAYQMWNFKRYNTTMGIIMENCATKLYFESTVVNWPITAGIETKSNFQ